MAIPGQLSGAGGEGETFPGLPCCRDLARLQADIVLIGAAGCTPYPTAGFYCAGGPAAIRAAGAAYGAALGHRNFDLGGPVLPSGVVAVDGGDLPQDPADAAGNRARIFGAVSQILEAGAVPVLLGGDDSLPIPMIEAFGARGQFVVLQIDAHIDWRDEVGGRKAGPVIDHAAGVGNGTCGCDHPGRAARHRVGARARRAGGRGLGVSAMCRGVRWRARACGGRSI